MAVETVFRSPLSSESATSMLRCTKGSEALLAQGPMPSGNRHVTEPFTWTGIRESSVVSSACAVSLWFGPVRGL